MFCSLDWVSPRQGENHRNTCEVGYRWLDVKPGAVDDSMAQELEKVSAVIDDLNRTADEAVTAKTMLTRFTDIVSGRSG